MKLIKTLPFAALVLLMVFTSCKKEESKDNTGPSGTGTITYDGTVYTINQAEGENYGKDATFHEGYNIDLIFVTDGIVIQNDTIASGSGYAIYLESFVPKDTQIDSGVYTYSDGTSGPHPLFTFSDNSDIFGGNFDTGATSWESFVDGSTYTVVKNGNSYSVTFDLTTDSGKKLTGTYSGGIPIF